MPVEVSLWVTVIKSYLPVASTLSTISGSIAWPNSTLNKSVGTPFVIPILCHRSPNEPQENTAALFAVQHLMEPSIKPVPEDVDNNISLSV